MTLDQGNSFCEYSMYSSFLGSLNYYMAVTQIMTACRDKLKFKQTCIFLKSFISNGSKVNIKINDICKKL